MTRGPFVRRVAVLGAGVMGAQIAAHLANVGVEVWLFDLPADAADPRRTARDAIGRLAKLDPAPLASPARAGLIHPASYAGDLGQLGACDLVIEAIAERIDWKHALYARIAPALAPHAVLASNTSGLGIDRLAEALPAALRARFCGVHFFNPPRYMALVELVPGAATAPEVLDRLETFLTTTLGKSVIRARDTPNFIANRIGVFSILAVMHHTQAFGLPLDLVDALTGPAIGRPKSATYRTADVVGLDTLAHVVRGSAAVLADDPWAAHMVLPAWLDALIARGALGQKSGAGLYRKDGKAILVLDPARGDYVPVSAAVDPGVAALLARPDPAERLAALRASAHPQARFVWAIQRDVFHYAAHWLASIADNARDLDLAMRWGFGWAQGPFETWQAAGWREVAGWIAEDIAAGRALGATPLPAWVATVDGVHRPQGSYAPAGDAWRSRSALAVYARQPYPERVFGEAPPAYGETAYEDAGVRLWHDGDRIGVLSLKSKLHTLGAAVIEGISAALALAETRFDALVIWPTEAPFSVGANLVEFGPLLAAGDLAGFTAAVARFQQTLLALRDSPLPVVAAVQGLALGGGCELLLHCDRVVAALESYIGLPEAGVGLLPAGGGSKELVRRAALAAQGADLYPFVKSAFETIAMAKVGRSAEEARTLGFLRPDDVIVAHPRELLYVAKSEARALAERGYRPPPAQPIRVLGRGGLGTLKLLLLNMAEGGFISAHDHAIAVRVAEVLCGGDLDADSEVTEAWLLDLERRHFVALAATAPTQARIEHMLKTGKPLRN
ncbi:3-hydroxyacyl-CoA dehydrogenase [Plasticicumulans lactativorans]|uniref:3-hydroxyacyl-CoA dehydrogenase n=1 Tax=Plasticicumulans lactativorans TaxID=1133106 RepID=A0A4R2L6V0_9GAMM|nr:3-hydroxyacyl-CoA dehydrogenase/enoyl-CoA hydratase family protein [Plasticicumulans lactativorans]TCO81007.1 3-hydroxyacyl-CoA dehydrogenase [Plasticicumulans lactativorans]